MASCNTNNSRFFSLTKHKIRDSAKLMLCEYVTVVYTSIQNNSLVQHIHWKQFERFCGKKQSFKMFNDIIPTMYIQAPKWEFWVFLRQIQNHQNQHFYMLCAPWGVALLTIWMTCPNYHTLQTSFLWQFHTTCELTEGSPRCNCTFTSSIRRAPSRPGTVRIRKRAESGEMCEI